MRRKKGQPVRHSFFASNGLPIGEQDRIEITRKGSTRLMLVEGVRQILLYGAEEMAFLLKKERLIVRGRDLDCVSYASGAIGITGEFSSVSFEEGE
jgi:hypothetical protein